jgi:hypothetical protein
MAVFTMESKNMPVRLWLKNKNQLTLDAQDATQ